MPAASLLIAGSDVAREVVQLRITTPKSPIPIIVEIHIGCWHRNFERVVGGSASDEGRLTGPNSTWTLLANSDPRLERCET